MNKIISIFTFTTFIFLISSTVVSADFFNSPPNPPLIDGPKSGQIDFTYNYYFTLSDPDFEDLMFNLEVDFGNNIIAKDCGCDKSWTNGTIIEMTYQWDKPNDYGIRARVQGEYGDWSEWSEPYVVTMPHVINNYFNRIIYKIIYTFPLINQYFEKYSKISF
jgi:hypothetical protein